MRITNWEMLLINEEIQKHAQQLMDLRFITEEKSNNK